MIRLSWACVGALALAVTACGEPTQLEGEGPVGHRQAVLSAFAAFRAPIIAQRQEQQYVSESYKDSQGKWQSRGVLNTVTVTDADLAMIRQHFPKLADVVIEIRPVEARAGSWQTVLDAARRYGARP